MDSKKQLQKFQMSNYDSLRAANDEIVLSNTIRIEWDIKITNLVQSIEDNLVSYIDSELHNIAWFFQKYNYLISNNKHDRMIKMLNFLIAYIWDHESDSAQRKKFLIRSTFEQELWQWSYLLSVFQ